MVLLLNMGVHTVGDLVRLPRTGFARRLGVRWLDELDRAFGRRAQARRGFRSPERFDVRQFPIMKSKLRRSSSLHVSRCSSACSVSCVNDKLRSRY